MKPENYTPTRLTVQLCKRFLEPSCTELLLRRLNWGVPCFWLFGVLILNNIICWGSIPGSHDFGKLSNLVATESQMKKRKMEWEAGCIRVIHENVQLQKFCKKIKVSLSQQVRLKSLDNNPAVADAVLDCLLSRSFHNGIYKIGFRQARTDCKSRSEHQANYWECPGLAMPNAILNSCGWLLTVIAFP